MTLHRGRGPHHARKAVVGNRETRSGPSNWSPAGARREGRDQPEGGLREDGQGRTQSRKPLLPHLARVYEAARRGRKTQFTALLHHMDVPALYRVFCRLKRLAAAGVDGETVVTYAAHLAERLQALCDRVHIGRYRP